MRARAKVGEGKWVPPASQTTDLPSLDYASRFQEKSLGDTGFGDIMEANEVSRVNEGKRKRRELGREAKEGSEETIRAA